MADTITAEPHTLTLSLLFFSSASRLRHLHSFPTRRSSDLVRDELEALQLPLWTLNVFPHGGFHDAVVRSEEHTSELQSLRHLVCRLLLEKNTWVGQRESRTPPSTWWGTPSSRLLSLASS